MTIRTQLIASTVLLALLWLGYFLFAGSVADAGADRWGEKLIQRSANVIISPARFLRQVMFEGCMLMTAIVFLAGTVRAVSLWCRRFRRELRWAPLSAISFALLNLWLLLAGQTTVFWAGLYAVYPNLRQTGFHVQRTMLNSGDETKIAVLGSSQGLTEFDCGIWNEAFRGKVRFGNLSHPGNSCFDLLLVQQHYVQCKPKLVVCYLSEMNIYSGAGGGRVLPFATWATATDIAQAPSSVITDEQKLIAACGVIPFFKYRRSIELAIFGRIAEFGFRPKRDGASASKEGKDAAAQKRADSFRVDEQSDFQKKSLRKFLERHRDLGAKVVIVIGQVNPVVGDRLAAEVISDRDRFYQSLVEEFPEVEFWTDQMFRHPSADYDDFMHLRRKRRFEQARKMVPLLQRALEKLD